MGLFKKRNKPVKLNFHCSKCDIDFSKDEAECRKMVFPIHGNREITYFFTTCTNCGEKISVRHD